MKIVEQNLEIKKWFVKIWWSFWNPMILMSPLGRYSINIVVQTIKLYDGLKYPMSNSM